MTVNLDAERALLGGLLIVPGRAAEVRVSPADLDPAHGHDLILAALLNVLERDGTADIITVAQELTARGEHQRVGQGTDRAGSYLHTLMSSVPTAANVGHYARMVRDAAARRRFALLAGRLGQAAERSLDHDLMLDIAAEVSVALTALVDDPTDEAPVAGLTSIEAFIAESDARHQWVVPGLLERQDRFLLIAAEGVGKSTVSRMLAVMVASGLHPFAPHVRIPPQRTLLVDLENPPSLVRRQTRQLWQRAVDLGVWTDERAFRWTKPSGLDLRKPPAERLLGRVLAETRPALVCIGPLYKMFAHRGGESHEVAAGEAAAVLDRLRERHGCALWIEHHMPKEQDGRRPLLPFGSSLWQRWPEFGRAMKQAKGTPGVWELEPFRYDRDVRHIPVALRRSATGWPWQAIFSPETHAEIEMMGQESA